MAFSRQHEDLFVALDAGAQRRGVLMDADARLDLPGAVARAGDVEASEALRISKCGDAGRARRQLLNLWAQKHWARQLPRLGLADADNAERALTRQPRVTETVREEANPLARTSEAARREHLWSTAPRRQILSETAPAKLMGHASAAQLLKEELKRSGEFLRATDDRVRRDMERTLAMSSRAAPQPRGICLEQTKFA